MTQDANTKFLRWCWDLDKNLKEWCNETPKSKTDAIIRDNVWKYDRAFSDLTKKCLAPGCGYPLKDTDNFQVLNLGEVCYLCWVMYAAVKGRFWFIEAQRLDDEARKKTKGFGI